MAARNKTANQRREMYGNKKSTGARSGMAATRATNQAGAAQKKRAANSAGAEGPKKSSPRYTLRKQSNSDTRGAKKKK